MRVNSTIWPDWELVRQIGRGSFGKVYEIKRIIGDCIEVAALKVITIPRNNDEIEDLRSNGYDDESITHYYKDTLGKIEREYAMMANLKGHKNIMYCDDIRKIQHEDGFGWDIYIKMELLTPLKVYLTDTVSDEQVIRIGIDICNALELCKEMNVIHRDIKPENIMVSRDNIYKLGDFGIARTMEHTTNGTIAGTYDYMAPEIKNSRFYHNEVDIYSLGMVMYWLLNERTGPFLPLDGKKPTPSMKVEAWDRRFSGEPLPAPKNGSKELKNIILKACAYSPAERYQSPQEMKQALEQLLDIGGTVLLRDNTANPNVGETVLLEPADTEYSVPVGNTPKGSKRKKIMILSIIPILLIVMGIAFGMIMSDKSVAVTLPESILIANSSDVLLPYVVAPKEKNKELFVWKSSDEQIVKVIEGNVIGLNQGVAKVTLTYKGVSDSCQIFVCESPIDQEFYELIDQNWYYAFAEGKSSDDALFYINNELYFYYADQEYSEPLIQQIDTVAKTNIGDFTTQEGESWRDFYQGESNKNYLGSIVLVESSSGNTAFVLHNKLGTYIMNADGTMMAGNSNVEDNGGSTIENSETTTSIDADETTVKKPETTTAKTSETTTAKKPETTTAKKPETTTTKKPETTTAKKPETTTAKKPETTTAKEPEATTAKEPEATTEAVNKAPSSLKISLSKSSISLYERFTVVVTPNVSDYTKIVIHAIDPTGSRWDFSMSGTNSKTLYVDDANLKGTWKISATVTNPYGSYTGGSVSLNVQ